MDRVFESGAVVSPPSPPASPSSGYPSKGNPGGAVPATKPGEYWFYMMTEELRAVLVAAGITPDHTSVNQLSAAIQKIVAAGGIKVPVRAATTANIASLAGGAPSTLDGVTLVANDRILVKDQTTGSQNGIYVVTTLGSGANGTWSRATDADAVGEIFAGMVVVSTEGTTNADALWELTTDGAISIGTTALTFVRKDVAPSYSLQGAFKNLSASATGTNASISIAADEVVLEDASNNYVTARNVALTINSAANGANGLDTGTLAASTWYYIWVIRQPGGTTAGLLSLSSTAPTMPGGYTYKARVGATRTDGSGNKYPLSFVQSGRRWRYKVAAGSNVTAMPQCASGVAGSTSTPTWASVAMGSYVPPTAALVSLVPTITGSSSAIMVAPNNAFGSLASTSNPPPIQINNAAAGGSAYSISDLLLESSNIYWASGQSSNYLYVAGFEDNL